LGRDSSELLPQSRPKPSETFGFFFETRPKKKLFSQICSSDFFGLLARALSEFFGFFCPNFSDFFVRIFRTAPLQVLALESKSVLLKIVERAPSEKFGQKNPKNSDKKIRKIRTAPGPAVRKIRTVPGPAVRKNRTNKFAKKTFSSAGFRKNPRKFPEVSDGIAGGVPKSLGPRLGLMA
jgi:hypothetical protein